MSQLLQFAQLQSCVDVTFWSELASKKLDEFKLSEEPVPITGWLTPSRYAELPGQLQLEANSFAAGSQRKGAHCIPGSLLNLNTEDRFKALDKKALMTQLAAAVWADICSGAAEQDPSLLSRFTLLAYGDLKQFRFQYWFAFPALKPPSPFTTTSNRGLSAALGEACAQAVASACNAWLHADPFATSDAISAPSARAAPAAAPEVEPAAAAPEADPATAAAVEAALVSCGVAPCWLVVPGVDGSFLGAQAVPLSKWQDWKVELMSSQQGTPPKVLLAVSDPNHLSTNPGWPLRNLLLMVAKRWGLHAASVLCVRESRGTVDAARCLLFDVQLGGEGAAAEAGAGPLPEGWCEGREGGASAPDAVGWESNAHGKLAPRVVDLGTFLSPHHQAEQAVDLNLRLMRWRAAPDLDTSRMAATKCLLIGAGTLGCAVSRTLLAWGTRHITFVDSSKVSFSNPVRQTLFEFEDCLEGGKPKAAAAAAALRRIFPSVVADGKAMSVPMPGHPPTDDVHCEEMRKAAEELDHLVSSHDVIFLLTDTRESRWLPSLLAAAHGKLAITSALGFDALVVMRHGAPPPAVEKSCAGGSAACGGAAAHRLGCYFCNDIVAPVNSTVDRTLDQQCTVARPGLAQVAGALAVELVAALVQHPLGIHAPAPTTQSSSSGQPAATAAAAAALGPVPHMIRSQLNGFSQVCMVGSAFSQCTACSDVVVQAYKERGWAFLLQAIQSPRYLEDLTGLTALLSQACQGYDQSDEGEGQGGEEGDDWTEM